MDEEFSSALLTGCVLLASCGLYPARAAERFARRMPISLPQEASLAAHRLPPTNDPHVHPPILVGHAVELATAQPPPTTTARSTPTPRLAQHRLRQLQARGADSGRPRAGHGRSGRPRRPRPSQPSGCLPTAALQDLTSAGHSGRGNAQTPDADTGRRTADTWTLRRPHRTLDTGPVDRQTWTLVTRTGHRTPDTGRGRGQSDDGAAGIRTLLDHHAERPHAGTPNRVPVDGACGARQPMQARR
jgi:hypothetical protein